MLCDAVSNGRQTVKDVGAGEIKNVVPVHPLLRRLYVQNRQLSGQAVHF